MRCASYARIITDIPIRDLFKHDSHALWPLMDAWQLEESRQAS